MEIKRFEYQKLWMPIVTRSSKLMPGSSMFIMKMYLDDGTVGLSEGLLSLSGKEAAADEERLRKSTEPFLGKEPVEALNTIHNAPQPWDYMQVETALYDALGKVLRVPLYALLGGKHRDRVPVAYWTTAVSVEDTIEDAKHGAEMGFKVHKLKARPWNVVETVEGITKAVGPDYAVRLDPNATFEDAATTVKLGRQLAKYNIQCFESPFLYTLAQIAEVRRKIDIPIAAHGEITSAEQLLDAINMRALDYICLGPWRDYKAYEALATTARMKMWLQFRSFTLGIGAMVAANISASIKNATLGDDTLPFLYEDDLTVGFELKDGFITLSNKPGLGVEIDEHALREYAVGEPVTIQPK